jgi:hypothetical protein
MMAMGWQEAVGTAATIRQATRGQEPLPLLRGWNATRDIGTVLMSKLDLWSIFVMSDAPSARLMKIKARLLHAAGVVTAAQHRAVILRANEILRRAERRRLSAHARPPERAKSQTRRDYLLH